MMACLPMNAQVSGGMASGASSISHCASLSPTRVHVAEWTARRGGLFAEVVESI